MCKNIVKLSRTVLPVGARRWQPPQLWCPEGCLCAQCTCRTSIPSSDCPSSSRSLGSGQRWCDSQTWCYLHVCISGRTEKVLVSMQHVTWTKTLIFFYWFLKNRSTAIPVHTLGHARAALSTVVYVQTSNTNVPYLNILSKVKDDQCTYLFQTYLSESKLLWFAGIYLVVYVFNIIL